MRVVGKDQTVTEVDFRIDAIRNGKTQSSFMPVTLNEPTGSDFTAYSDLTQAQVLEWVAQIVGEEEINALKNGLNSVLIQQEAAEEVTAQPTALPW